MVAESSRNIMMDSSPPLEKYDYDDADGEEEEEDCYPTSSTTRSNRGYTYNSDVEMSPNSADYKALVEKFEKQTTNSSDSGSVSHRSSSHRVPIRNNNQLFSRRSTTTTNETYSPDSSTHGISPKKLTYEDYSPNFVSGVRIGISPKRALMLDNTPSRGLMLGPSPNTPKTIIQHSTTSGDGNNSQDSVRAPPRYSNRPSTRSRLFPNRPSSTTSTGSSCSTTSTVAEEASAETSFDSNKSVEPEKKNMRANVNPFTPTNIMMSARKRSRKSKKLHSAK